MRRTARGQAGVVFFPLPFLYLLPRWFPDRLSYLEAWPGVQDNADRHTCVCSESRCKSGVRTAAPVRERVGWDTTKTAGWGSTEIKRHPRRQCWTRPGEEIERVRVCPPACCALTTAKKYKYRQSPLQFSPPFPLVLPPPPQPSGSQSHFWISPDSFVIFFFRIDSGIAFPDPCQSFSCASTFTTNSSTLTSLTPPPPPLPRNTKTAFTLFYNLSLPSIIKNT
ncbi:hypothetical protein GGS23DRAFT_173177 [Durotheca rogersii]|uniref:uncharacterized protein n=1 Tax=Durotheca rogersii TaxID=419775 RepID=UPI0022211761|nr:uncharacterized protein GGS23DRAFT_173177 [Durotheca rogersii]KAI5867358.1 hypothetical protein GGS23DRAFT_173177 [Durotheca rogersii]